MLLKRRIISNKILKEGNNKERNDYVKKIIQKRIGGYTGND